MVDQDKKTKNNRETASKRLLSWRLGVISLLGSIVIWFVLIKVYLSPLIVLIFSKPEDRSFLLGLPEEDLELSLIHI